MLPLLIYLSLIAPPDSAYKYYITQPGKLTFQYQYSRSGAHIGTFQNLVHLNPTIQFAMNAAMYTSGDYAPVGLYVENGIQYHKLVLLNDATTNFGLAPQGVFYIDKNGKAGLIEAVHANSSEYKYAVELAPLLIINGQVNPRVKGMTTKHVRNAMGLLKNGQVLLIISTHKVSMEQLANKMKSLGCIYAAYVDGGVSEYWQKGDAFPSGEFGVMVAAH